MSINPTPGQSPFPTGNLNTLTLKEFTDLVKYKWKEVGMQVKHNAMELFMRDDVGLGQGEFVPYSEFDYDHFGAEKPQGQNVKKGKAGVGYQITANVRRFGMEIDITDEMIKFNKYGDIMARIRSLWRYYSERVELDLTHRITFGLTPSYVTRDGFVRDIRTADGQPLFSSTHQCKFNGITYSNLVPANPLPNEAGLEAAETLYSNNMFSNFGEKITKKPTMVFYHDFPSIENQIMRLFGSSAQITALNAGVENVYKGKYRMLKLPYLATTPSGSLDRTKQSWWGLVAAGDQGRGEYDETRWQAYCVFWETPYLVDPISNPSLYDSHADIRSYGIRWSWDVVVISGRGIVLSSPNTP